MRRLILTTMILLGACARQETLTTTFDPNQAAFINQPGSASISGQAFLTTVGGDVKYGAGSDVLLVPATTYATERVGKIYGNGKCNNQAVKFNSEDQRYLNMVKHSKANGEGRFRFDGLSAGTYFVMTRVSWGVATQYGVMPTGCNIYESVLLTDGQTREVILSGS